MRNAYKSCNAPFSIFGAHHHNNIFINGNQPGADALAMTADERATAYLCIEDIARYDFILVDTCFLLSKSFPTFLAKHAYQLKDLGCRFHILPHVREELVRHVHNSNKALSGRAIRVQQVLRDNEYKKLFQTSRKAAKGEKLADYALCFAMLKNYGAKKMLLLTQDHALARTVLCLFNHCADNRRYHVQVLTLDDSGEISPILFNNLPEYIVPSPQDAYLCNEARTYGIARTTKHDAAKETAAPSPRADQKARERFYQNFAKVQEAVQAGPEHHFQYVSESCTIVMDNTQLRNLTDPAYGDRFFSQLLCTGFAERGQHILVSASSLTSPAIRRLVAGHPEFFCVIPAKAHDISEETALLHIVFIEARTRAMTPVCLLTRNKELLPALLARRPRCFCNITLSAAAIMNNGYLADSYGTHYPTAPCAC